MINRVLLWTQIAVLSVIQFHFSPIANADDTALEFNDEFLTSLDPDFTENGDQIMNSLKEKGMVESKSSLRDGVICGGGTRGGGGG